MNTIQFDELTPGATVRFTLIDGVKYLSIRDIIMVVCQKDINQAGEVWRRLNFQSKYDLNDEIKTFKFHGRGQKFQDVVSLRGAIAILSFLPGFEAKANKQTALRILSKYSKQSDNMPEFKKRKRTEPESYVYLLHSAAFPDYVKIGRTQNIQSRLSSINCSMPEHPYQLVTYFTSFNAVRDEAEAHQHFEKYRTIREFFKISKEEVIPYFLEKQNNLIQMNEPDVDYFSE